MALRFVFLDFGHTLAHEARPRSAIYTDAARAAGVRVTVEEMARLMHTTHAELGRTVDGHWRYSDGWFRRFIARIFSDSLGVPSQGLDELAAGLFRTFRDARTFEVYPGTHELLRQLRASGLGTGIISNWSPWLDQLTTELDLRSQLDVVVSSADVRCEKPDAEIFELACERAGVRANECLHAGDHPDKDCAGAQAVGMRTVLVDHAGTGSVGGAWPRVTSLHELARLVLAAHA